MVNFINQHGDEEVSRIKESTANEYTIEKNKYVDEQKKVMDDNYKAELQNEEVKMKIQKSKKQNEIRIERMRKINEYIEELKKQTKSQIKDKMKSDQSAYKKLLEDLLVQGLIKMMEAKLYIRCRESDKSLIESVKKAAIDRYTNLVVKEVKRFKGKSASEIPCEIIIDGTYLESIEDNPTAGIIGGFKLYAKKGRIVCSQTIDDRIELCF